MLIFPYWDTHVVNPVWGKVTYENVRYVALVVKGTKNLLFLVSPIILGSSLTVLVYSFTKLRAKRSRKLLWKKFQRNSKEEGWTYN